MRFFLTFFILFCVYGNAVCAEKVLKVGMDRNFPPFEYVEDSGNSDKLVGFDVDLLAAISKKVGFTYQIQLLPFKRILIGLETGWLDIGISAITVTEERSRVIDFSDSYCSVGLGIFVSEGSSIENIGDLGGKRVGVLCGTYSCSFVNENAIESWLVLYHDFNLMVTELKKGGIDAIVVDTSALSHVGQIGIPFLKRVGKVYAKKPVAIAFPQNSKLVEKVNTALAELKKSGEYSKLYQRWIKPPPAE